MIKNNKISKVISSVLILILFFGLFGIISQFTNGFQEEFKTFYVTYKEKDIFATESKLYLNRGEEHRFDMTYTFEFLDEGEEAKTDYSIKIVPNVDEETDFNFTMDGNEYAYSSVGELTGAFNIVKEDKYFTINIPSNANLETVLTTLYGKAVEAPLDKDCPDPYLYTLVVSSYDESVTYNIDFAFGVSLASVELNKSEVVF